MGAGRPTVMTPEVLRKLEMGFLKGLTDVQCCVYAGIGTTALYDYCKEHPEFAERKEALKQQPSITAKLNIVEAVENGDIALSMWYLERKNKDEFSQKQIIDAEVKSDVNISISLVDDEE